MFVQTRVAKFFWILIVLLGFSGACFLINSSYRSWTDSPVSTTISTHPIDDLAFPSVTVCPPQGLNTALNYDLMGLSNVSFSDEDKEMLTKSVYEDMIEKPHRKYSQKYQAFMQHLDLKRIYDGLMSVPTPYEAVVDESKKSQFEKRKRNLKEVSPISRGEREI